MNRIQQIILAIIAPIISLLFGLGYISTLKIENLNFQKFRLGEQYKYINVKWNNLSETWWIWLVVIIVIGIFEYWIFSKSPKK